MTFKEFKNTDAYKSADILELVDKDGCEFEDAFPEDKLDAMNVVTFIAKSGWISIVLS